ncbi:hypothetical protein NNC19_01580 [Clostridium sp. SHJSY1]|uniref:hypothetical protein n=1 Tax=Clostridium sp. SHJSY1 TaxID=2942483 RepID=UPI002876F647|nr:hypothetical protein [Clostridium sp. SHJSY1]MDS0524349.1 hypothetical protein [Clostridium sp. SHJSY1]
MNQNKMGPDNKCHCNSSVAGFINVKESANFKFDSDASWDQAICIYKESNGKFSKKIEEKGTSGGRNLSDWQASEGNYMITGWHKEEADNRNSQWVQSDVKITLNENRDVTFGFEDGFDSNFTDITATCDLH